MVAAALVVVLLVVCTPIRATTAAAEPGSGDDNPCTPGSLTGPSCTITSSDNLESAFSCAEGTIDDYQGTVCTFRGTGSLVISGQFAYSWGSSYVQLMANDANSLTVQDANLSAAAFLVQASSFALTNSTPGVSVLNTSATGCGTSAAGSPQAVSDGATHGGVGGLGSGLCYTKQRYAIPASLPAVGDVMKPWSPLSTACGAGVAGGGAGGGIINITTNGSVTLYGWLLADGGNATNGDAGGAGGGGAGGTITVVSTGSHVQVNTTAKLSANGGATLVTKPDTGSGYGGGGGGRIFLESQSPWTTIGNPWSATAGPMTGSSPQSQLCLCGGAGPVVVCVANACIVEISNDNACVTEEGVGIGPTMLDISGPAAIAPRTIDSLNVQKQAVLSTNVVNISTVTPGMAPMFSVSSDAVVTNVVLPAIDGRRVLSSGPPPANPVSHIKVDVGRNGTVSIDNSEINKAHTVINGRQVLEVIGGLVSFTSQTSIASDVVLISATAMTLGSDSATGTGASTLSIIEYYTCAKIDTYSLTINGDIQCVGSFAISLFGEPHSSPSVCCDTFVVMQILHWFVNESIRRGSASVLRGTRQRVQQPFHSQRIVGKCPRNAAPADLRAGFSDVDDVDTGRAKHHDHGVSDSGMRCNAAVDRRCSRH